MKRITGLLLIICLMTGVCGCASVTVMMPEEKPQTSEAQEVHPKGAEVDLDGIVKIIEERLGDDFKPKIGIILGSGLHALADEVSVVATIPYEEIPGFPVSTVSGHAGKYIFGYLEDVPVVLMKGRVHYYEGYSMEEVITPVRVMSKLGADTVILTNAAGSLRKEYPVGTLVCIEDHIASFVPNPLIGQNDDELGERFVDMTEPYDDELRKIAHEAADELGIDIMDGVYLQVTGPTYETSVESEMYADMGADVVGMSTACETIALRHMGTRVLGFSCITDFCPNVDGASVTHEMVQDNAEKVGGTFVTLLKGVVKKITEEDGQEPS